jgi:hypothetical protein
MIAMLEDGRALVDAFDDASAIATLVGASFRRRSHGPTIGRGTASGDRAGPDFLVPSTITPSEYSVPTSRTRQP